MQNKLSNPLIIYKHNGRGTRLIWFNQFFVPLDTLLISLSVIFLISCGWWNARIFEWTFQEDLFLLWARCFASLSFLIDSVDMYMVLHTIDTMLGGYLKSCDSIEHYKFHYLKMRVIAIICCNFTVRRRFIHFHLSAGIFLQAKSVIIFYLCWILRKQLLLNIYFYVITSFICIYLM